jgi:hypothetical protein
MSDAPPPDPKPVLPSHRELCLDIPLYAPIVIEPEAMNFMRNLREAHVQFDAHCLECGESSTFKYAGSRGGGAGTVRAVDWMFLEGFFSVCLSCTRHGHRVIYEFLLKDKLLKKIGQYPSMEDIAGADIEKFRKILGQNYFSELRRATGLASHGIGIGSFVYLRRIFERLVSQHREELALSGTAIPEFEKLRMDEKISALAACLPPALVRNKAAYAILSKGLHELDEDTCRAYFPVVRAAIVQILEQDFQAREAKLKEEELERAIARISADLGAKKRSAG